MKIKELLDSPEKWTKRTYSKTNGTEEVAWCLTGARWKCYDKNEIALDISRRKLEAAIRILHPKERFDGIELWNDNATWEQVKAVLELANV